MTCFSSSRILPRRVHVRNSGASPSFRLPRVYRPSIASRSAFFNTKRRRTGLSASLRTGGAPEPHGTVVASRGQNGAVGREEHRRDPTTVSAEVQPLVAGARVPERHGPVFGAGATVFPSGETPTDQTSTGCSSRVIRASPVVTSIRLTALDPDTGADRCATMTVSPPGKKASDEFPWYLAQDEEKLPL